MGPATLRPVLLSQAKTAGRETATPSQPRSSRCHMRHRVLCRSHTRRRQTERMRQRRNERQQKWDGRSGLDPSGQTSWVGSGGVRSGRLGKDRARKGWIGCDRVETSQDRLGCSKVLQGFVQISIWAKVFDEFPRSSSTPRWSLHDLFKVRIQLGHVSLPCYEASSVGRPAPQRNSLRLIRSARYAEDHHRIREELSWGAPFSVPC